MISFNDNESRDIRMDAKANSIAEGAIRRVLNVLIQGSFFIEFTKQRLIA